MPKQPPRLQRLSCYLGTVLAHHLCVLPCYIDGGVVTDLFGICAPCHYWSLCSHHLAASPRFVRQCPPVHVCRGRFFVLYEVLTKLGEPAGSASARVVQTAVPASHENNTALAWAAAVRAGPRQVVSVRTPGTARSLSMQARARLERPTKPEDGRYACAPQTRCLVASSLGL